MSFKIRKANDEIVVVPVLIQCHRYKCQVDKDGFLKKVYCTAKRKKKICKTCSLRDML